jgi:nitrile hydratase beta subunit
MNGIHDVGGADGFGKVLVELDEPVFHADWERTVFSFLHQIARAGYYNLDEFRSSIERMTPIGYLATPYYAHWMHAFEEYLTRADSAFARELDRRTGEYLADPELALPPSPSAERSKELVEALTSLVRLGASAARVVQHDASFDVGDRVRVSSAVPVAHTRKPGYVRGAIGIITGSWGAYAFPDTSVKGLGECPEYMYTVEFASEELFGEGIGDPKASIFVDLWEPYLLPLEK